LRRSTMRTRPVWVQPLVRVQALMRV